MGDDIALVAFMWQENEFVCFSLFAIVGCKTSRGKMWLQVARR